MSKKSAAARRNATARKSQASGKASSATFVSSAGEREAPAHVDQSAAASTPVRAPSPARPRAVELKDNPKTTRAATKAEQAPARQQGDRATTARVTRARAAQRARTANLINPENYTYVLSDLKLILTLAAAMFIVLIVLHFALA